MDGNPAQIVTAGVTNTYAVDAASRITQLTDGGLSSNTWNFTTYDSLDRIKAAGSSAKSRGYTYDANGNASQITGTTASTETISTTNNQLTATSGGIVRSYGYDAAGNTTSYTGETFTFNQRGRMSSADSSAGTTNYVYNALGQLIEKSGIGGTTLLMYDEAGHLLGEYTSTGALIQETVWMGDRPVATLQPNGASVSIYYVHADHLGTPRKVTRPSDNGLMWRYDPDTYGASTTAANGNPAGLGTFVYNLRLPGQYFLSESGLSYNYFRTYDPAVRRYLESDPIGLKGGINTYAYAHESPVQRTDPTGLESPQYSVGQIPLLYPKDNSSSCNGRCRGSDRWSYTPPAVCSSGDAMCGIAMQAAGIPSPYYSTTHVVSRKCVLTYLALAKPAGYIGSSVVGRQVALATALRFPAIAELALDMTGPASGVIALPFAMDEIVNSCSCDK